MEPRPLFEQPWPGGGYTLWQLGFVVEDLLGAAQQWADTFRVGPFLVRPRMEAPCTYRGRPSGIDMQNAVAQAGPVQIELIQQFCDRPSVYREISLGGRQAFHQICTITTDYDRASRHYLGLGYELACEWVLPDRRVGYFDTLTQFGFYTEVVEHTDSYIASLTELARTARDWDGRDPVRLMTPDGYRIP